MTRFLIAGGAGFIGSHLSDSLLADGHEVYCVDSLVTGRIENLPVEHENFELLVCDITNEFHFAGDVDWVLHLASIAAPDAYQNQPIQTLKTGSIATHQLLELARKKDASFLFTSTSEVYGDPEIHPQIEQYNGNVDPTGPRSCYDESKRYAEALTESYHREYGLPVRIPRLFNTYGPRMRDGRVIPTFVKQALDGTDLSIHGDGKQTRSFCYVSDAVDALRACMQYGDSRPVNIGNPDERTILELAKTIVDLTGSASDFSYTQRPPDDPQIRQPDISRAHDVLDWEPDVSLRDGLRRTISARRQSLS